MSRANEPAYPSHGTMGEVVSRGLTIREHFAAMAMQGFAACPSLTGSTESIVKAAVKWADALLAELAKPSAPVLDAFDAAVAAELPRVSTLEYNSHEICKYFAGKVRGRLAELAKERT